MKYTASLAALLALCPAGNAQQTAPPPDPDMGAKQIVGLFTQACVVQYGDIAAVRAWLDDCHVPHMPDQGAVHFLAGKAGIVYDASNPTGRYGVTTLDNGVCDAFAETAQASEVIDVLEKTLKAQKSTVIRLDDHPESKDSRLHHYDYLIIHDGVNYDLVASVSDATQTLQAQIGFWRRSATEALPNPLPAPQ
jgi:hypothetical protein